MHDGETPESKPALPASVTHFGLNCLATCVALGALFGLRLRDFGLENDMLVLMAAAAAPVIVLDLLVLRVHRRSSTGLDWEKEFSADAGRVATKILGLALTLAPIAIAYWAFAEYHGTFYDPFYGLLRRFWASLVIAAVAYTWGLDGLMVNPRDAYWQLGRVALGHSSDARAADIANLYRGWLVKAFFLPLMLVWMHNETRNLIRFDLTTPWLNLHLYHFLYSLIFGVDLLFATVGYCLSLKLIDAHIRTAEPTMFGWVVALFCYQPFYSLMERQYVHYDGGLSFDGWLAPWPLLRWIWAGGIVLLIAIYVLATIAFGVRFSNLTHRGILTNGPYRFTKHPAYVSKNLSWWMASIPFVPHTGWQDALRHSLLLGCVNTIYFLRAKTEERHLSRDPTYVAYALWMNDHGTLRFIGRLIPFFKYKAPVTTTTTAAGAVTETSSTA
ncbi:MAG: isoprenylcysteine carboxylmethyltransferase family protein [Polyangiaceae bacterium]